MFYLIGGAPRCGKTTIAKYLSKRLGIAWISSDTLEAIAMGYATAKDFPKRFPKTIMRKKTKRSNDLMYNKYSPKQIAGAYLIQSQVVWKGIEMLVEAELVENRSYIIEGYHIHPQLVLNLQKKYGKRNFKSVFLTKTDVDNIVTSSEKYTYKNDWFMKRTKEKEIYKKIAEMVSELSRYFLREGKKHGLKVFNMDKNFARGMREAQGYLRNN